MIEQLEALRERFEEVSQQIGMPEIVADMAKFKKISKEYKDLEKITDKYKIYKEVLSNLAGAKELLENEKDEELREMAKEELEDLQPRSEELEEELKELLMPKDPNDDKNAILEVRAGAGGDEASIFAGDLFRMYQRFVETQEGWTMSIMDINHGTSGGYKEIIAEISGEEVYGKLKFESGVHRVQRVPATESQGRVHTSAASVAILAEADEVDFQLNMGDIKKDTFRASGAGGQHVNKTESAVRLTHLPTNTVVECQDGRSQHQNYDKALTVLRSRLYEAELKKHNDAISSERKSLVGSGDRSDKIRTYNYPQSRVTDHRIGLTVYNLPAVMDGNISEFIEKLRMEENANKMKDAQQ